MYLGISHNASSHGAKVGDVHRSEVFGWCDWRTLGRQLSFSMDDQSRRAGSIQSEVLWGTAVNKRNATDSEYSGVFENSGTQDERDKVETR